MDEYRGLDERELEGASGGGDDVGFSELVGRFARANRCCDCRYKSVYRHHEMCMEVYDQILLAYTLREDIDMKCRRRA